ncbi:uncharacterized protein Gasu_41030 [Galdieria sulphuraria]|uniref:Nucleolar GTP-binding protein 1 n=1 Tax=Galdieria sulphuraria TaxID=130081 RepID=M2WWN4_GALSU|nr:uncharacterized protein Gasu_41030 [Galdieria sulphuraria]EME28410.1 hypothetical protein Gasu_41030 [Galdieria sulphuraria]|eukprot:XP_005704930.1 hypothetical protein Gasu_41030 [Galdieria sulphuraria]
MVTYNLKKIQTVPGAKELIDIVLSKTQRKTPTVIHRHYAISRIRQFYMRKIKFAQQTFHDKLSQILQDFPKVDEIHPFYADLLNVLYDRDHYKLALGQLSKARSLIDNLSKEYLRLLKYGDSLYRCKMLKRAAVGRMCTIVKRLASSFGYLERVRQHMARLPSIDPHMRCLIIAGYPNVGKSSFMNLITRANVDVQPYPFTTKSLYVGHMDYRYLRWQVIDTPGILDKPLEERNTIEMQSITALAHLRATILFFLDPSEHCGFSWEQQIGLFHSLEPLFVEKPLLIVCNKTDLPWQSQVEEQLNALVRQESNHSNSLDKPVLADGWMKMSTLEKTGVVEVRNTACDLLLSQRVESKVKGPRAQSILNRLHVAVPASMTHTSCDDQKEEESQGLCRPFIPESVWKKKQENKTMEEEEKEPSEEDHRKDSQKILEKDLEMAHGGAGVYSSDWNKHYLLRDDSWKYDIMPEIVEGHNILDFIDTDIDERLAALEEEEVAREAMSENDEMEGLDEESQQRLQRIRDKKVLLIRGRSKQRNPIGANKMTKAHPKSSQEWRKQWLEMGMDKERVDMTTKQILSHRSQSREPSKPRSQSRSTSTYRWNQTKAEAGKGFVNHQQKQKALHLARKT